MTNTTENKNKSQYVAHSAYQHVCLEITYNILFVITSTVANSIKNLIPIALKLLY